jgi:UrcA family protein
MSARTLLGVIAAALTAFAPFAEAHQFDVPPVRIVRFTQQDLSTARGVRTLYVRIREAARSVCDEAHRPDTLFPSPDFDRCVKSAIDSAVAAAHQPALDAYLAAHRPHAAPSRLAAQ